MNIKVKLLLAYKTERTVSLSATDRIVARNLKNTEYD